MGTVREEERVIPLPVPTVYFSGLELQQNKDYTVAYNTFDENVSIENGTVHFDSPGICTVHAFILGKGDYTGSVEKRFDVEYYRSSSAPEEL